MVHASILTVLKQRPLGMVFDIDGTLSPIVPTPDEAKLYPGVAFLLRQLSQKVHVAILTGRSIENGARMVNVEGLTYVGTHGLEYSKGLPWLHPVHVVPEAIAYIEPARKLLDFAERQLAYQQGIIIEHKNIGGAIHYRLAERPEVARQKILSVLEKPASQANLCISEGKLTIEIRPPLKVNKGQALRTLVDDWKLQGVLFAGDERTDLDAMLELASLQQENKGTFGVAVQYIDTLPELLEHADYAVQGVEGMVSLLQELAEVLNMNNEYDHNPSAV